MPIDQTVNQPAVNPLAKPAVNQLVIAAFDFDGTLTERDTLMPFLASGLGWPRFLLALLVCSPWLAAFALRLMPNHVAKQKLLQVSLHNKTTAQVDDWTTRWLGQSLPGQLQSWSMARLFEHQQAGHCCVLVSASPDIYLKRVARQLGFDALLCTEMAAESGRLTGLMKTPNCHGEQKVLRLKAWMTERFGANGGAEVVYAYGDTPGDKPMLRMAKHAFYRGKPWPA
ncbi:MAG: HAD-IB family hydrolase [Polaromonas sp.]|jgi:phosphatidylglycerophosphatase C